jgi:hypothetical protein
MLGFQNRSLDMDNLVPAHRVVVWYAKLYDEAGDTASRWSNPSCPCGGGDMGPRSRRIEFNRIARDKEEEGERETRGGNLRKKLLNHALHLTLRQKMNN